MAGLGPAIHDFLCEIKEVANGRSSVLLAHRRQELGRRGQFLPVPD
jgi:hypothetical protein